MFVKFSWHECKFPFNFIFSRLIWSNHDMLLLKYANTCSRKKYLKFGKHELSNWFLSISLWQVLVGYIIVFGHVTIMWPSCDVFGLVCFTAPFSLPSKQKLIVSQTAGNSTYPGGALSTPFSTSAGNFTFFYCVCIM